MAPALCPRYMLKGTLWVPPHVLTRPNFGLWPLSGPRDTPPPRPWRGCATPKLGVSPALLRFGKACLWRPLGAKRQSGDAEPSRLFLGVERLLDPGRGEVMAKVPTANSDA